MVYMTQQRMLGMHLSIDGLVGYIAPVLQLSYLFRVRFLAWDTTRKYFQFSNKPEARQRMWNIFNGKVTQQRVITSPEKTKFDQKIVENKLWIVFFQVQQMSSADNNSYMLEMSRSIVALNDDNSTADVEEAEEQNEIISFVPGTCQLSLEEMSSPMSWLIHPLPCLTINRLLTNST